MSGAPVRSGFRTRVLEPRGAELLCTLLLAAFALLPASGLSASDPAKTRELAFRVLLDDREIGFHRYELQEDGARTLVESTAEFDVKFLFFNAYRYRHALSAEWDGSCLTALDAETDANGDRSSVTGTVGDNGFVVETNDRTERLPECIMNFAYWDRSILDQDRLLNPQTGEYLDVDVENLGKAQIRLNGEEAAAIAYRLTAKDMQIDLWYAEGDGRWLALESLATGGRIIRYELT